MCMVALSTISYSQKTTVNYEYPNLGGDAPFNYKEVTLNYLRISSADNLALQKEAYGWIITGTILNAISIVGNIGTGQPILRGFILGGGVCYAMGGIQLATVNARNTKITFALTHPITK